MAVLMTTNNCMYDLATKVFEVSGLVYRQYEWTEAVEREEVSVLIVKHVILVFLVITGFAVVYKVRRLVSVGQAEEAQK
jgi:hypothetical protein